ncbi:MAG: hypothetical protein JNM25_03930 [Planctomycetes bacterium]|nr:hypothetical protein [Planctomycetota bacterium]
MSAGIDDDDDALTVADLLLDEGTPEAQQALRSRIADEPELALAMAETVALFESFRQLRVEPSASLGCRLSDVVRRAERRTLPAPRPHWLGKAACVAAAAVIGFAVLWQWDPLGRRAGTQVAPVVRIDAPPPGWGRMRGDPVAPADPVAAEPGSKPVMREAAEVAWEDALRGRLGLETSRRLEQAFEAALRPPSDPLRRWLEPRNALASLRADHELRAHPEVRRALLQLQGGLVAVDERVQELTGRIAAELSTRCAETADAADAATLQAVALGVRALIAAGAVSEQRSTALACGGDWLAARLSRCTDARLVVALAPLVELEAIGGRYGDLLVQHGSRLIDEVLRADDDTWGRRRPELLSGTVPVATIADAARLLRLLPGVGVDAARCHIVRQLLLGRLRERRDAGDDGPGLLAAMLYGCADLLAPAERDEVERELRRWTPLRLAPDFVTVHQLAWGFEPGRLGFTRLQRELRRLAVLPDPGSLAPRAAFCLCLATGYAAWPGDAASLGRAGD